MSSHETVLLASSLGHAPGLGSFGCVLHVGASLVIIKSGCIRAFEGFRQLCTEYKVRTASYQASPASVGYSGQSYTHDIVEYLPNKIELG